MACYTYLTLKIKTYQMQNLIKDIKKLTNFFQFLQDFDPKDYQIDTCTEYDTVTSEDNNKESYIL